MTPEDFAALIAKAVKPEQTPAPAPAPEPVAKAVTLEDVQNLIVQSFAEFSKAMDTKIQKATEFSREGTGRVGTVDPKDARDADPIKYIVKKAQDHNELDQTDKDLIAELTSRALRDGMKYGEE